MRYPQRPFLALVLSFLLWGLSFPALKMAIRTNSPVTVLFYRYTFVFLLVLPYFLWRHRGEASVLMRNKALFILGLSNWAGSLLQFAGLHLTSSIKCALLTQTTVVAVPILAVWVLGERLDGSKVIAILISLIGVVMLSTNLDLHAIGNGSSLAGDGLTVAAVVFWAIFIIYTRRLTQWLSVFWLLWANTLTTFLLSGGTVLVMGQLDIDRTGLGLCLFLAVFCTILPLVLYNYALKDVDATTSAIVGPIETVSAALLSVLCLGERLTPIGIAGSLLILASIYLVDLPFLRPGRSKGPQP
jgi:drug/metabolite transporter (DMT)-like permease